MTLVETGGKHCPRLKAGECEGTGSDVCGRYGTDRASDHPAVIEQRRVAALERRAERMAQALRVIRTWASFRGGVALCPGDVIALVDKALEEET